MDLEEGEFRVKEGGDEGKERTPFDLEHCTKRQVQQH